MRLLMILGAISATGCAIANSGTLLLCPFGEAEVKSRTWQADGRTMTVLGDRQLRIGEINCCAVQYGYRTGSTNHVGVFDLYYVSPDRMFYLLWHDYRGGDVVALDADATGTNATRLVVTRHLPDRLETEKYYLNVDHATLSVTPGRHEFITGHERSDIKTDKTDEWHMVSPKKKE